MLNFTIIILYFTIMDLQKKFLLPHRWQCVGVWLIVCAILLSMALIAGDITGVIRHVPAILGWIPAFIGLMLVCLSQEKVDDEYISVLRGRLVSILVAVAFISGLLSSICDLLGVCFRWYSPIVQIILSLLHNPFLLGSVYIIALKLTLYIINRKINRYAEK